MSQQSQRCYPQGVSLYRGFREGEERKDGVVGSQRDALERIHHGTLLAIGGRIDHLVVYHHRGRSATVEVDHIPSPLLYQIVGILDHRALVGRDDEELLAVFGDSHQRAGIVLKLTPRSHEVVILLVVQLAVQDDAGPTVEGLQHLLGRRNRQSRIGKGGIDKTLVDLHHIAYLHPTLELGSGIVAHEENMALPVGLYGGVAYRDHPARGRLTVDNPLALRLQLGIESLGRKGEAAVCIEENTIPVRLYPVGRLVDVVDFDFGLVRANDLGLVAGRKYLGHLVLVDREDRPSVIAVMADDFAIAHVDSRRRSLAAVMEQIVVHTEEGPVTFVRIATTLRRGGLTRGIGSLPVRRIYLHGIILVVQVECNLKELDRFLSKLDVGIHRPRSYGIVCYRVGGTPLGFLGLSD